MEPGPSGVAGPSSAVPDGGQVQQTIMNPIPGPSHRPYLATPVQVPPHFLVPEGQLLPHQVRSGIDIGNLFKILNALQNRIALACGQHQYMKDPLHHPRPPEDGGYKPLTTQAAVRDIRSLCRQQRNLMEKLRRWNCINEGKCYDLIINNIYSGICKTCEPFALSRQRMKFAARTIRRQNRIALRRKATAAASPKPSTSAAALANSSSSFQPKQRAKMSLPPAPPQQRAPPAPQSQSPKKRRKLSSLPPEPPHPEEFLTQENFLNALGLVTPEVKNRINAESKRTERRRRTTANPKYKSASFVDSSQIGRAKRSRRGEPETIEVPNVSILSSPTRLTGAERRRAMQKRYECSVCGNKDLDLDTKCDNCLSGFHAECIRVSGSRAEPPDTVSYCPNCVPSNSNISASDCIVFSRRMFNKPSIMDARLRGAGNARVRRQAAAKRKGGGRAKTAAQRRATAKSAKSKKQSFRAPPPPKARTAVQKAKKSIATDGTLNRSSAVAAADAIPAYYSSSSSASKNRRGSQVPKKETPASKSKPPPVKNNPVPRVQDQKRVAPTKEKVTQSEKQSQPSISKKFGTGFPAQSFSNGEITITPAKSETIYAKKSAPPPVISVTISSADDCYTYTEKWNENAENVTNENCKSSGPAKDKGQAKPAVLKSKKPNDPKPRPVDPFCMKRTMMAMSAAAGLVLSSSGMKASNLSPGAEAKSAPVTPGSQTSVTATATSAAKQNTASALSVPNKSVASTPAPLKKVASVAEAASSFKSFYRQGPTLQSKPIPATVTSADLKAPVKTMSALACEFASKSIVRKTGSLTPKTNVSTGTVSTPLKTQKVGHKPGLPTRVVATTLFPELPVKQPSEEKKVMQKKKPATQTQTQRLSIMSELKIERTIEAVIRDAMTETITKPENAFSSIPEKKVFNATKVSTTSSNLARSPALPSQPAATSSSASSGGNAAINLPPQAPAAVDNSASNNLSRCSSPTSSDSSTIGSSRSMNDVDSDSDDLLSIPDTPYRPSSFYGVRREEPLSGPLSSLGALDRLELLNRKTATPAASPTTTTITIPLPKKSLVGGWIAHIPN